MTISKTLFAVAALVTFGLFGAGTAPAQTAAAQRKADKLVKDGQELQAKGKLEDALDKYEEALKYVPKHKVALVESAWCYNEIGEYEDAHDAAEDAVGADPTRSKAWRELGFADWKQGDLKEAKANLQMAIDLNRYNTPAYTHLIKVLEELGEFKAAKKLKKQKDAVELDMIVDPKLKNRMDD